VIRSRPAQWLRVLRSEVSPFCACPRAKVSIGGSIVDSLAEGLSLPNSAHNLGWRCRATQSAEQNLSTTRLAFILRDDHNSHHHQREHEHAEKESQKDSMTKLHAVEDGNAASEGVWSDAIISTPEKNRSRGKTGGVYKSWHGPTVVGPIWVDEGGGEPPNPFDAEANFAGFANVRMRRSSTAHRGGAPDVTWLESGILLVRISRAVRQQYFWDAILPIIPSHSLPLHPESMFSSSPVASPRHWFITQEYQ
jgi:hypothetical protein